ncbi:hypothetical protein EZI54_23765 [Marinobacter halodurans]|uniref:Uncharacterized protein n=1 Tax=Marinobacter halodurans TaxID=2528979 RepID=A0ABY1ZEW6_9GAMM|nr:hypothetical protein [Marinobacter halodurans]TBW44501.1 hypothetical protein EZI54_23765 [Marinobacter halodurans]
MIHIKQSEPNSVMRVATMQLIFKETKQSVRKLKQPSASYERKKRWQVSSPNNPIKLPAGKNERPVCLFELSDGMGCNPTIEPRQTSIFRVRK